QRRAVVQANPDRDLPHRVEQGHRVVAGQRAPRLWCTNHHAICRRPYKERWRLLL
ncbi:hypothetical protein GGF37_005287, partial [Kickxella alabastrina]